MNRDVLSPTVVDVLLPRRPSSLQEPEGLATLPPQLPSPLLQRSCDEENVVLGDFAPLGPS